MNVVQLLVIRMWIWNLKLIDCLTIKKNCLCALSPNKSLHKLMHNRTAKRVMNRTTKICFFFGTKRDTFSNIWIAQLVNIYSFAKEITHYRVRFHKSILNHFWMVSNGWKWKYTYWIVTNCVINIWVSNKLWKSHDVMYLICASCFTKQNTLNSSLEHSDFRFIEIFCSFFHLRQRLVCSKGINYRHQYYFSPILLAIYFKHELLITNNTIQFISDKKFFQLNRNVRNFLWSSVEISQWIRWCFWFPANFSFSISLVARCQLLKSGWRLLNKKKIFHFYYSAHNDCLCSIRSALQRMRHSMRKLFDECLCFFS